MSILREHATAYLAMRRSLGYKLDGHGRLLMKSATWKTTHTAPSPPRRPWPGQQRRTA